MNDDDLPITAEWLTDEVARMTGSTGVTAELTEDRARHVAKGLTRNGRAFNVAVPTHFTRAQGREFIDLELGSDVQVIYEICVVQGRKGMEVVLNGARDQNVEFKSIDANGAVHLCVKNAKVSVVPAY